MDTQAPRGVARRVENLDRRPRQDDPPTLARSTVSAPMKNWTLAIDRNT